MKSVYWNRLKAICKNHAIKVPLAPKDAEELTDLIQCVRVDIECAHDSLVDLSEDYNEAFDL